MSTAGAIDLNTLAGYFPILAKIQREWFIAAFVGGTVVWLLLEAVFAYVIIFMVAPRLQNYRKPVTIESPPMIYFKKIFDAIDVLPNFTFSDYISGFCLGAPVEEIQQENIISFISWGVFGKRVKDLTEIENIRVMELHEYAYNRFEECRKIKPGFNPNVKHVSFTLEPVRYVHRPLCLYVMAGFSEFSFNMIYLRMLGFQFLETEGMNYWIKEGSSSLPPLLIFHGISSGWSMYSLLIQQFSTDRTVILADLDAIKILSMYFYMPSIQQYNASILRILRRHRIDRVSVIGHSFGSITANWLISKCPQVVSHLTLIDPVAILVCMPQCVNNFIYRSLHRCRSIFEGIIWFFAAREITISYALHRNFIWHSNCMWLQEIPKHIGVVVALAANDEISDAALQLAFVKSCDAERKKTTTTSTVAAGRQEHCADITAVVWKGFSHGQILYSPKEMDEFRAIVNASEKVHL